MTPPVGSGPLHRLVQIALRNERAWVNEPARARRLSLWGFFLLVLALAAIATQGFTPESSWPSMVSGLLLGALAGLGAIGTARRGMAYRNGWLDGRTTMVTSLHEAMRRDMTPQEWLEAEMARDYAVLGLTPPPSLLEDDQ